MKKLSERQRVRLTLQNQLLALRFERGAEFRLLDLGTEHGHTARSVKAEFPNARITGVEIHKPTLDLCQLHNGKHYDELVLEDALEYLRIAHTFDAVIAAEIIEHLEKVDGWVLLERLKKVANFAIVTSPLGFMAQGALFDNPHQVHKTGWTEEEFVSYGYRVEGTFPAKRLGVYSFGAGVS